MSTLGRGLCDRRRGGSCRRHGRRRPSPADQLALFATEAATCKPGPSCYRETSDTGAGAEARCRTLTFARLIVPGQHWPRQPNRRLDEITAIVVGGPEGRPLVVVTDDGWRQLYRNIVDQGARAPKEERVRSGRAMDQAIARLETQSWFGLRMRAERLARGGEIASGTCREARRVPGPRGLCTGALGETNHRGRRGSLSRAQEQIAEQRRIESAGAFDDDEVHRRDQLPRPSLRAPASARRAPPFDWPGLPLGRPADRRSGRRGVPTSRKPIPSAPRGATKWRETHRV